jgi:hypothetical protein
MHSEAPGTVPDCSVSVFDSRENCYQLLAVDLMYNSSFYPVVLGVSGQPSVGLDSLNMTVPSFDSGSGRTQDSVRLAVFSDTLKLLFAKDSVHRSVFDSLQMAAEALNSGRLCSLFMFTVICSLFMFTVVCSQ